MWAATGSLVQCGSYKPSSFLAQAQLAGGGSSIATLLTCSSRAVLVGGIRRTLFVFAKNFFRVLSMSVHVLVLSYSRITNLSMVCMTSSGMSVGAADNFSSASVSSGSTVQIAQAVFLPYPVKLDTVSHPVRAWNIGRACGFSSPRPTVISWAARYRKLLPVPNAIHSSSSGYSPWATDTANTTTLVSTTDHYLVAMLSCMGFMQQLVTVSFFMVAWGERGQIWQW